MAMITYKGNESGKGKVRNRKLQIALSGRVIPGSNVIAHK